MHKKRKLVGFSFERYILFKPLILLIVISLWPLLKPLFFFLQFDDAYIIFIVLQTIVVVIFCFSVHKYLKYVKFLNYSEANEYYQDLKRVIRAERNQIKLQIQDKIKQQKLEKVNKMKHDLEERKNKVL